MITAIIIRPATAPEVIQVDAERPWDTIGAEFPEFDTLKTGRRPVKLITDEDGLVKELLPNFMLNGQIVLGDGLIVQFDRDNRVEPTGEELSAMIATASDLAAKRPSRADVANWKRSAGVQLFAGDEKISDEPIFDDLGRLRKGRAPER